MLAFVSSANCTWGRPRLVCSNLQSRGETRGHHTQSERSCLSTANKSWCFDTYTHSVWIMQLNTVKFICSCSFSFLFFFAFGRACLVAWCACVCQRVWFFFWLHMCVCDSMSMCLISLQANTTIHMHHSLCIGSIEILGDGFYWDWCVSGSFLDKSLIHTHLLCKGLSINRNLMIYV